MYGSMVFSIALKICKEQTLAEEVVQDSFVKVYQQIHRFKGNSKFSTWIYRIAVNTSYTKCKRKRPKEELYEETINLQTVDDGLNLLIQKERKELVKHAIGLLPEMEAIAISMYYIEEYTVKDVSLALEISESYAKVKLHRARKMLKEIIVTLSKK